MMWDVGCGSLCSLLICKKSALSSPPSSILSPPLEGNIHDSPDVPYNNSNVIWYLDSCSSLYLLNYAVDR